MLIENVDIQKKLSMIYLALLIIKVQLNFGIIILSLNYLINGYGMNLMTLK